MSNDETHLTLDRRRALQAVSGLATAGAVSGTALGADEEGNAPRESPAAYQREIRQEIMTSITRNIRASARGGD